MTQQESSPEGVAKRERLDARDAQFVEFLDGTPEFESVKPLVEPPLDITRSMLQLLNMRDETVIVHEPDKRGHTTVGTRRGAERGAR
jgi:hypothetical protein